MSSAGTAAALIHDLSEFGLRIETETTLQVDEIIRVQLPETGPVNAKVVWTADQFAGCRFLKPVPRASVSAALLRSPPKAARGDEPWRVELPMIDVIERPAELRRAVFEPEPAQLGPMLFVALIGAFIASALFVGFLLLMAISGEAAP